MVDLTIPAPILHAHQKTTSASPAANGEVVHPASVGLSHKKAEPSSALTLSAVARVANLISDFQDSLVNLRRQYAKSVRGDPAQLDAEAANDGSDPTLPVAPQHSVHADLAAALRESAGQFHEALAELRRQPGDDPALLQAVGAKLGLGDGTNAQDPLQTLVSFGVVRYEAGGLAVDTQPLQQLLDTLTTTESAATGRGNVLLYTRK